MLWCGTDHSSDFSIFLMLLFWCFDWGVLVCANIFVWEISGDIIKTLKENGYEYRWGNVTVKLAEAYGFCWGVERAVQIAYEARKQFPDERIWITNEIIHNPTVNKVFQFYTWPSYTWIWNGLAKFSFLVAVSWCWILKQLEVVNCGYMPFETAGVLYIADNYFSHEFTTLLTAW